jgi:hypothetical protein
LENITEGLNNFQPQFGQKSLCYSIKTSRAFQLRCGQNPVADWQKSVLFSYSRKVFSLFPGIFPLCESGTLEKLGKLKGEREKRFERIPKKFFRFLIFSFCFCSRR